MSLPASFPRLAWFLRTLALGVLSLLALLGIGLGSLSLPPVKRALGGWIAAEASERSGLQISCEEAQVLPRGLELVGVRVQRGSETLLSARAIELLPEMRALLDKRVLVREVVVNGLELHLGSPREDGPPALTPAPTPPPELEAAKEPSPGDRLLARLQRLQPYLHPDGFSLRVSDARLQEDVGLDPKAQEGFRPLLTLPSLQLTWPSPGQYPLRVDLSLGIPDRSDAIGLGLVLDEGGERLAVHVQGPGFSLEALRAEALERLPETLKSRLEPLLARLPVLPTVGGDFTIRYDHPARRIQLEGAVALHDLTLVDERLATVPFGPFALSQNVRLEADLPSQRLIIDRWEGRLGQAAYRMESRLELRPDLSPLHLKLTLFHTPYQALLDAFPPGPLPALAGVRLGGDLDLTLEITGDLNDTSSMDLSYEADWSRLVLLEPSLPLRGPVPLLGFVYRPHVKEGSPPELRLGRDQPWWVPLEQLPNHLIQALLLSEDSSFYQHEGFDTEGLRRALVSNLKAGKAVRGGSTITQQLAKNLFLSRERTLVRKLQEAVLAWELEQVLGKKQILETYLNIIEWGPQTWGIRNAAQLYFGKLPWELSVKEAAYLCTIIPNPIRYYYYFQSGELSPFWEGHLQGLIDRMRVFERISEEQYQLASEEGLYFRGSPRSAIDLGTLEAEPDPEEEPPFFQLNLRRFNPGPESPPAGSE